MALASMKTKIVLSLIVSIMVFAPHSSSAHRGELYSIFGDESIYAKSSIFVRASAKVGIVLGGATGLIIGIPVGLVNGLVQAPFEEGKTLINHTALGALYGGIYGRKAGDAVFGAPFFALEHIFYDIPKNMIFHEKDTDSNNVEETK